MKAMEDKVTLVTGAGAGMGRVIALKLAEEGGKIVAVDLDSDNGLETVKMIEEAGGQATFFNANIADPDQVEAMIKTAVDSYGRLDCAVNNAGVEAKLGDTVEQTSIEDFDRVFGVNVRGTWLCMRQELIQMQKQGYGVIVNVASALGLIGVEGFSSYVSTKHAMVGLTKCAALENATKNIRVNALCPAAVRTPMLDRATGIDWDSTTPMQRVGTVDEVANGALFLCSDASSFTTGHTLLLDGGWVAG